MKHYDHKEVEKKMQDEWYSSDIYTAKEKGTDGAAHNKFYGLIEFPFPSGDGMHVGHLRSNTAMDIICRMRRMQGYNVLYPIGWDAFGLPTETYAIKTGKHPEIVTKENTDNFRRQLKSAGFSFDWSREINTTDPAYYKWTQWIFLQMFKKGLAYQAETSVWWCEALGTVLANEEVIDGKSERGGHPCEKRALPQWMLAITKYADRLDKDLDTVDYLERIKIQQRNWIGKSEGVNLKSKIKDLDVYVEMYDSIPQTFAAQTFSVIAPEHPLVEKLIAGTPQEKEVREFVQQLKKKKESGSYDHVKEMEGIFTGRYVEYAPTGRLLPIWIASFVVADYGTGFVNCSAHDERDFAFAKKYNIELHPVLLPADQELAEKVKKAEVFYRESDGILQEPAEFKGRMWSEARQDIIKYLVKNGWATPRENYKLRDWVFSRQRYWGEPFPIVWVSKSAYDAAKAANGSVANSLPEQPVMRTKTKDGNNITEYALPIPEKFLPVVLPHVDSFAPKGNGESALGTATEWLNVYFNISTGETRVTGGEKLTEADGWYLGHRETDTMPNWAGSSWYYLRYADPKNPEALASKENLAQWSPVDWYNGGMEHTTLHLLYSRFWHKFLFDIGVVPTAEPYQKRTSQGMILAEDGEKMSKSRGNVVNPDSIIETYGADTLRVYEMFMGPFDQMVKWSTESMIGPRRFIERVWKMQEKIQEGIQMSAATESLLHKTIKKVSEDIENMSFNTAISSLMILVNEIEKEANISKVAYQVLLKLLAPFAPHVTDELWRMVGNTSESVHITPWPVFDEKMIQETEKTIAVQVNGKVRATISVASNIDNSALEAAALAHPDIIKWLDGKAPKKVIVVPGKLVSIVV